MAQRRNGTNFIESARRLEVVAWDSDLQRARAECAALLTDDELAEMNAQWDALDGADLWQRSHFVNRVAAAAAVRERLERATDDVVLFARNWCAKRGAYNQGGGAQALRQYEDAEMLLESAVAIYDAALAAWDELENSADEQTARVVQIPRQWLEDTISVPASVDLP